MDKPTGGTVKARASPLDVEKPWAILPSAYKALTALLTGHADLEAASKAFSDTPRARGSQEEGVVAIIPLHGTIVNRAPDFLSFFGITSPQAFTSLVRKAADDPRIKEIVFSVDSGGVR